MTEVTSFEKRRIDAQAASFDAFNIGDVHVTYGRTVTQTHLVNFTAMAGMQLPLFINHNLAQDGPYGEPIVPGFLTASLSGGMMESVLGTNTLAGLGMDGFRFKTPVKMGDTLYAEIEIVSKKVTQDEKRGVLGVHVDVVNHRSEVVLEYTAKVLMNR